MLPVIVLGAVLGNDETFRRLAREVDGDDEQAHRLSARYVRSGAGRRAIAAMLLSASTAPPNALTTRLMNMSRRRAAFIDGPPDEGDARYALRGETLGAFQRGPNSSRAALDVACIAGPSASGTPTARRTSSSIVSRPATGMRSA